LIFILPIIVLGSASKFVEVSGSLLSCDKDFVFIQTETKNVKVPRSSLLNSSSCSNLMKKVVATISFPDLIKLNKK
jgi:hypothetical protein